MCSQVLIDRVHNEAALWWIVWGVILGPPVILAVLVVVGMLRRPNG